jgi:hypothetical protein
VDRAAADGIHTYSHPGPAVSPFVFFPFPSLPVRLGCSRARCFPSRRSGDPSRHHSDERLGSPFLPFDPACWSSTASMSVSPVSRLTLPHRTDRPSRVLFQDLTSHPPSSRRAIRLQGRGADEDFPWSYPDRRQLASYRPPRIIHLPISPASPQGRLELRTRSLRPRCPTLRPNEEQNGSQTSSRLTNTYALLTI